MLGDGNEVLTDSDETEMFDHDEEDKDLPSQVGPGRVLANEETEQRSEREGTPAPPSKDSNDTGSDNKHHTSEPAEIDNTDNTATPDKSTPSESSVRVIKPAADSALPTKLHNPGKDLA